MKNDGAQSIARACSILRIVARHNPVGLSLAEVKQGCGLTQPTAHRILRRLAEEDMISQQPMTKRYVLGPLAMEFGLHAGNWATLVDRIRPSLDRLRVSTGDTIYLLLRSGPFSICLERLDGIYPIGPSRRRIGEAWPLGLGAGGLALLAALDEPTALDIIRHNSASFPDNPAIEEKELLRRVREARKTGRSFSEGVASSGSSGIGVVIPNSGNPPLLSIIVGGIASRFSDGRMEVLHDELTDAASRMIFSLQELGLAPLGQLETA